LRVRVKPDHAVVSLDGKPLAPSLEASLPKDDAEHVLRAEAAGFQPRNQKVWLVGDIDLSLELQPQPPMRAPDVVLVKPRPARSAPPPRAEPAETAAPETAEPAVVDCRPPYTIDAAGMKHFRLECL
jgi:hypothetical protein